MFHDRNDVGQQLAIALKKYKNDPDAVVVALPRGGVVPGDIVARELNLPLELVMVKKIGHPSNSEFAIGAVSMTDMVLDDRVQADAAYIESETKRLRDMLDKRYHMYYGDRARPDFKDKKAIIIDDGVATGKTLIASIELIKKQDPSMIIVAVPVGPPDTIENLESYADEVICLDVHDDFFAISQFYEVFGQVSDEEVTEILGRRNQDAYHQ